MSGGRLLVVDAANVVGSRPDGWWRDRAGAAHRLIRGVTDGLASEDVVVVLEGAARAAAPEGSVGPVRVVHAPGSGDDTVIEVVTAAPTDREPVVVTADRGLRARVHAAGAHTQGPAWLWRRIDRGPPGA